MIINAAILIMAAATFHTRGQHDVAEIQDAYKLLSGALGVPIAEAAHLSPAGKGLVVAVPILSGSLLRVPAGMLADRLGARRVGAGLLVLLFAPLALLSGAPSSLPALLGCGLLLSWGMARTISRPIANAIHTLNEAALQIAVASEQVTSGSQALAEGASQQAASIEETAAAMEEISEGLFREDLFFRINTVTIHLPPLRERREDIPILASSFLEEFSRERRKAIEGFSDGVLEGINYLVMGTAIDAGAFLFRGRLDNVLVGRLYGRARQPCTRGERVTRW